MTPTNTPLKQKRARFYPDKTAKIKIKKTDIELFLWQDIEQGFFSVAGFYGRVQKPKLYIKTKTAQQREKSIAQFIEQRREILDAKAQRNRPHSLVVGDTHRDICAPAMLTGT